MLNQAPDIDVHFLNAKMSSLEKLLLTAKYAAPAGQTTIWFRGQITMKMYALHATIQMTGDLQGYSNWKI